MANAFNTVCPVGPEWDALVNHPRIGRFEAIRDWLQHGQEVRSVDAVLEKLDNENRQNIDVRRPAIGSASSNREFDNKLREKLLEFVKGLGIEVKEGADALLDTLDLKYGSPVAAFDTLQKFLALRNNVSPGDLRLQVANIVYTFLGKKSKLSVELWQNIDKWGKYKELYNKYNALMQASDKDEDPSEILEYSGQGYNVWARKQVIIEFLAEALEKGAKLEVFGPEKQSNPDVDKELFKEYGFRDKYEEDFFINMFNKIWNFINTLLGSKVIRNYTEDQLITLGMEIADDVYKKDYRKFIRGIEKKGEKFYDKAGVELEQKDFEATLQKNPFAAEMIKKLFDDPFIKAKGSGSLALRKYGVILRAVSEDLHDIDAVITLERFKQEENALAFRTWITNTGLDLIRKGASNPRYRKEFHTKALAYIERMSWFNRVKEIYPSYKVKSIFIGKDHKRGESVTVIGTITNPNEIDPKTNQPREYTLDFFLRTDIGDYPEIFDNYWKDWKQIYEAKLNMGRSKDIADLIYFTPFINDKYKFTNKGFRYFTFSDKPLPIPVTTDVVLPNTKKAYRGIKTEEKYPYRYYTMSRSEASDYGDVTEFYVDTTGFLDVANDKAAYWDAVTNFQKVTGNAFDLFDNSDRGRVIQRQFFDFLKDRGYKGLDFTGYSDSQYLISFEGKDSPVSTDLPSVAYNRRNREHVMALDELENLLLQAGYDISEKGYMNYELSKIDQSRIEGFIRSVFAPDDWKLKQTKFGNWYIAGYKNGNVFDPNYYSPATRAINFYRYNEQSLDEAQAQASLTSKPMDFTEEDKEYSVTVRQASAIADALSRQLGVKYQIIDADRAAKITAETSNPWSGEPAFFLDDVVYFVGELMSPNIAFHEFSHPFVRAIYRSNNDLFNKLYAEVASTSEGRAIIAQVGKIYEDLADKQDMLMEEVIVRALELQGTSVMLNKSTSKEFTSVIDKIIYAIKMMLSKIQRAFSNKHKVNVSELNPNTSLNELASMLASGTAFNLQEVKEETAADKSVKTTAYFAYLRDQSEEIKGLSEVAPYELTELATQGMKASSKTLRKILKDKNYAEMANVLKDEYGNSNIDVIKSNLRPYADFMQKRIAEIIDEVEYNKNHVEALVNTYFRLSKTIKKITTHLQQISQDVNNPQNIAKAASYRRVIKYWEDFIDYSLSVFASNNVPSNNKINELVAGIKDEIRRSNEQLSYIKADGIRETLFSVLEPIGITAEERFNEMLEMYRRRGFKQYVIDRLFIEFHGLTEEEYNSLKEMEDTGAIHSSNYDKLKRKSFNGARITREKIEELLKGNLNDVNWMNSYFESYMYNDDPVVGGLSLFVKQAIDQTMVKSQAMYNDIAKDLLPLLEKIGYSPSNIGKLGEQIGFKDSFGTYNKDGEFTKKVVWTLLNPWKDYRYAQDTLDDKIKQARERFLISNTNTDKEAYHKAIEEKERHDLLYMHNTYVPEYYQIRSTFTSNGTNTIAVEALMERDLILNRIRNITEQTPQDVDIYESPKELDEVWREYNQLHSLYDADGKMKTGRELKIAHELQRYRDMSGKYYEYNPIEGAFENALFKYEQHLLNKGITGEDFKVARKDWIKRNTRVSIKPSFWTRRKEVLDRINEIITTELSNKEVAAEQKRISEELSAAYEKMMNAVTGFRDDDGQPEGTIMGEARHTIIKEQQEIIESLRDKVLTKKGLTKEELVRYNELEMMEEQTEAEENEYLALVGKMSTIYTPAQSKELRSLFKELSELSGSEPTDYYVSSFNDFLAVLDSSTDEKVVKIMTRLKNHYGSAALTKDELNDILYPKDSNINIIESLLKIPEFKTWFDKNHIEAVVNAWDTESESYYEKTIYKRTYAWNVVRPHNPEFYESYDIKDEEGRVIEKVNRIPNRRFFKREVKKEYHTGYNDDTGEVDLIVGVHIDNKGRFLPRLDAVNSPYRNEEYYNLKNTDPDLFKVLEAVTKWHIKIQDQLTDNSAKLWLDMARFEKSTLEVMRTKDVQQVDPETGEPVKGSWFKLAVKNLKQFFTGNKEMPESKFKFSDEFKVVQLDIFEDDEDYNAPIHGLYDIEIDDVSTDVLNGMLRYMFSAQKNATLTEIHPYAQALKDVLEGKGIDRFKKVTKKHLTSDGETTNKSVDHNKIRSKVVSNFVDREFYGQTVTGPGSDNKVLYNLSTNIFQAASLNFFALNIPSAIKNAIGQKIQGTIEAIAMKYYNPKDFALAEPWAFKTMGELSFNIYNKGPKSQNVQLWEIFDPTLEFQNKAAREGMSRTFLKDITQPTGILMNFRKWTELQSMMHIWAAMMHHVTVKQGDKTIKWIDAWEVVDGKMQLKAGIDPEWGITYDENGNQKIGKNFIAKRQEMQAVLAKLQGAYDDFNQPEAQRYMAWRFVSFMRRYFVPMFIDRFGFKVKNGKIQPRLQVGLGNVAEGWYISMFRQLYDTFRHGPKRLIYATPDERRAWLKTVGDIGILILLGMIQGPLFGWEDDDPDRYEKLRQKSGAMPGPFVTEDEYKFVFSGWLSNHALNQVMQIRSEQQQFLPIPGLGLRNYSELVSSLGSSAAFGPTIGAGFNLFQDVANIWTGNSKAYYQREVGPYDWQQEDGSKFVAHLAKSMGFTGTFWQPELGIKKLESIQQGFAGGR